MDGPLEDVNSFRHLERAALTEAHRAGISRALIMAKPFKVGPNHHGEDQRHPARS